jgi:hypothetical protein
MPRQSAESVLITPVLGAGFATLAVGNMLGFAFGPLRLEQYLPALRPIARRAAHSKERLPLCPHGPHQFPPESRRIARSLRVTAPIHASKHAPFLRDLCADLKPILEAELAAGNEIRECSRGWPEKESVIIGFRKPFRPPTGPLPPNVEYREINDTHWWKAEYAAKKPVHLLTCGF